MSELDEFLEYLYDYSESDGDLLFCAQVEYAIKQFKVMKYKAAKAENETRI